MASDPAGRGPRPTRFWTCVSAFSPENSFQISFFGAFAHELARIRQRESRPACHERNDIRSTIAGVQTDDTQDPLKSVVTIILDLDPASLRSMMDRNTGPE